MKHLKGLFTALLLVCCIGMAKAEEVTIDGIKYDVITKAKQATVIRGETKYSGSIVIPSKITHNNVTHSVTSIGEKAFFECKGLKSITIPNSVTSIGDLAFYYCPGLTSITIPNSVTSIGNNAFSGCTGLTSITIPNSVTSIGSAAFEGCSGLTSVTIPNSVTSIGHSAFYGCSGLTSVTIPNSVTSIGDGTFRDCSGLTSIEIPNSVTSIGDHAFYECSGLTSIVIGNGVTSIGWYAFWACSGLTSIEIPNSVTSIGNYAFSNCSGLTSIIVEPGNPKYDSRENCNAVIETESNTLVFGCKNTIIPNSVTSIGYGTFYNCSGLTSVTIPNSVTSIGMYTFEGCSGLTSIVIPNSVTHINSYAFKGCTGLTSVTIGTGVKNIRPEAFAKCENLADVYCLATTVPSTDSDAFMESYPEYMTLHVPAEAISSYKTTAPWSSFGTFATLDGEDYVEPEVKVCSTPVISYSNGKIEIECETEGAEFITTVTNNYAKNYYSNNFELSATYNISVYATAAGYEKSETVNATLCWIECECEGDDTGIINIPAKAVLVTSNNGVLHINCSLDGESVAVYTTDGVLIATTTIDNGTATIATGLSKGTVAIVKIAEKSIKVVID